MKELKVTSLILGYVVCYVFSFSIESDPNEFSWFGYGAEDNEDNDLPSPAVGYDIFANPNMLDENSFVKSSRHDEEDVEFFLNSGPMMAPNIILNRVEDSKISLINNSGILQAQSVNNEDQNKNMDEEQPLSDDNLVNLVINGMFSEPKPFLNASWSHFQMEENEINTDKCHMKFSGASGSFNLSFHRDCTILIKTPHEASRLLLKCSPIPLGDCATNRDALSINLLGDLSFRTNSFMYCGQDAVIQAISLRNQLSIRIKQTDVIKETSFCTFNTRHRRQYDPYSATGTHVPCGRLGRAGKIIGGRRVPPGLFPWAAQLDITRTDGSQTGCTGSVVSPHYILTAAHCMKRAESISAFMGGTDRHEILGTELLIQAEKYIIHKKWSSKTLIADIALLKLSEPIQYTDDISPICLPEGKLLSEDLSGRRGVAVGWGRVVSKQKAPRKLYRVKLPLLSEYTCRNIYKRFYIPKVMVCTDSKKDAAICYGMTRNFANLNNN